MTVTGGGTSKTKENQLRYFSLHVIIRIIDPS
jgi:hypothetical protein